MAEDKRGWLAPSPHAPVMKLPTKSGLMTQWEMANNLKVTRALVEQQRTAREYLEEQQKTTTAYLSTYRTMIALECLDEIRADARAEVLHELEIAHAERSIAMFEASARQNAAVTHYEESRQRAVLQHHASLNVDDLDDALAEHEQLRRQRRSAEVRNTFVDRATQQREPTRLERLQNKRAELDALREQHAANGRDVSKIVEAIDRLDDELLKETIHDGN